MKEIFLPFSNYITSLKDVKFFGDVQDEVNFMHNLKRCYVCLYDFQDYKTPKHFHITNNVIF